MKNAQIEELLKKAIKTNKIVNGYIFSGTTQTKNYEFARKFAKEILCLDGGECENSCKSCLMFDDNNNTDYKEIDVDPEKNIIRIDQIREMQAKVAEKPITSSRKVYVIKNAETMNVEAQNCLLKTLEEPPEFVTIILVSNNESTLLTTIKSRCMKIAFTEEEKRELTEEEKERYDELLRVFGNIEKYKSIELLNKLDVLYKGKDNIFENLEFINTILLEKARNNPKYADYIDYIEETKSKLKSNSNYDMTIDNLILKIWE